MNDPKPMTIQADTYRHYKNGKLYEVVGVALHTETQEQMVIYRPLYDSNFELFARPYDMFVGRVEFDGKVLLRFELVNQ